VCINNLQIKNSLEAGCGGTPFNLSTWEREAEGSQFKDYIARLSQKVEILIVLGN
jgi:hypothetical protein